MSIDMSRYLSLYVGEATEHLEALGRDLVKLEPHAPRALIDGMFRHAHSVKGMAASMGFESTAKLAHRTEDLLDALRADASKADKRTVDLLLAANDAMVRHVRAASESQPCEDVNTLLEQLTARLLQLTGSSGSTTKVAHVQGALAAPAPTNSAFSTPPRFALKVKVSPTSATPGVRAFLVYKRMSMMGNVFDLKPNLEELKAGRISEGLVSLELETSEGEERIATTLRTIAEVELLSVRNVTHETQAPAPPPAPTEAPTDAPRVVGQEPARTVKVRTELLDQMLDGAGELLLATARVREVGKALPAASRAPLEEAVDRLHGLVKDLHGKVMKARMTPIAVITDRLPRAARDIARRREREVELSIAGADIELDRSILDELADPLLHLLRNAVDHGIEPSAEREAKGKSAKGHVQVTVRRGRDRVILDLEDDGRGIDAEKLKTLAVRNGLLTAEAAATLSDRAAWLLCCLPGISTATDITDISGRGVGMDAVKRAVENVGGTLEIESKPGRGTKFSLNLPLTVAVVTLLLVEAGDEIYGLPISKVAGVVEAQQSQLSRSQTSTLISFGTGLVPVYGLSELLQLPMGGRADEGPVLPLVVMEGEGSKIALKVEKLLGQEEAVLKPLSRPLDLVPGLSGVTLLGNGRPIFVLDVPRLLPA
ncbi:MAG: chemotaxis protein CheA [Myxococcaceae bacterium]|nr:chemotaxis protein CheA [Myxococcaceae bacterium]